MAWGYRAGSYVNSSGGFGASVASQDDPLVLGASTVVGDRIVVVASVAQTAGTPPTYVVNDNRNSGNYTQDATFTPGADSNGNTVRLSFFSKSVTVAGSTTVTVHISNPGGAFMFGGSQAAVFTGLQVADPSDDGSAGAKGESASAACGPSGATTAANELVVAGYHDTGWGVALTVGSGYTQAGKHDNDGTNWQGLLQYKDSGASGSTLSSTVAAGGSTSWRHGLVVYKIVGGGPCQVDDPYTTLELSTYAGLETLDYANLETSPCQTVTPGTITTGVAVPGPTVNLQIVPGTVGTAASVPNPTVSQGAAQTVTPGAIVTAAAVPSPTVTMGAVAGQVSPGTITSGEVVPGPTVGLRTLPDSIVSGEVVYAPTVSMGGVLVPLVVEPETIGSSEAVYPPTVSFPAILVYPDTIYTDDQVYGPVVTVLPKPPRPPMPPLQGGPQPGPWPPLGVAETTPIPELVTPPAAGPWPPLGARGKPGAPALSPRTQGGAPPLLRVL